jgi:hypothetical protein
LPFQVSHHTKWRGLLVGPPLKEIYGPFWVLFEALGVFAMACYQDHNQLFHYVPAQEWGGATRDYKKSMHKKLSLNMARKFLI